MASSGVLDCLAKSDLLASGKASPEKLKEQADSFTRAGMDYDALRFLISAQDTDRIAELAGRAVDRGDLFLYLQARKALSLEPDPEELTKISRAAAAKGQTSFAAKAEAMTNPDGNQKDG